MTKRVAAYLRVSTGRQAEADLSLPDQMQQAERYCTQRGWHLVTAFNEAGASGTDEDRPEFQRMIAFATAKPSPVDLILVHSTSRFARDVYTSEVYLRRLRRAGVELASITQDIDGSPEKNMMRQLLSVFDQHQSRENAKHTHRAMRENARQGFWNGNRAPFGYRTVEAGQRGHRIKKILAINDAEGPLVQRVFALYRGQEGCQHGIKAIAAKLNGESLSFRGKPFSTSAVHRMLTAEVYAGRHWFDRQEAKSGRAKPRADWISVSVPALITEAEFAEVQALLAERNPKRSPPRVVSGPTLLTGLAVCASCNGGMTLRTGKSGRYRYYTCASSAHRGKAVCPGRSVPMDQLDGLVLKGFTDRVLAAGRLRALVSGYLASAADADQGRRKRLNQLRGDLTEAEAAKTVLLQLIVRNALAGDDASLDAELRSAEARRRRAEAGIALLEADGVQVPKQVTPEQITRIGDAIREALTTGDPGFRRAYVRKFISRVVVDDEEIRISGPTQALLNASNADNPGSLGASGAQFNPEWRPLGDSNPCYRRERAVS